MKLYEVSLQFRAVAEAPAARINNSAEIVTYMRGAFDARPEQEQFWVVILDIKNRPKGRHLATIGTQTSTLIAAREVYRCAVMAGASAVVCVHNHPSGDPTPSGHDHKVTRTLADAGFILDIALLDHVIIGTVDEDPGKRGFCSFRDAGFLLDRDPLKRKVYRDPLIALPAKFVKPLRTPRAPTLRVL